MSNSIKEIKKRDIVSKLHDRVINDLSNYSFEVEVIEDIAHYFDDLGHVQGPYGAKNRLWVCDAHNVLKIQMACREGIL